MQSDAVEQLTGARFLPEKRRKDDGDAATDGMTAGGGASIFRLQHKKRASSVSKKGARLRLGGWLSTSPVEASAAR